MSLFNTIRRVFVSDLFKHSATLLSANVISQLVAFAVYPFLTRVYGPSVFGGFSFFMTIVAVLSTISTGKYELAILLPESERKVTALFHLSNLLNVLFFSLLTAIVFIGNKGIAPFLGDKEGILPFLPLIPFFVFFTGIWQSLSYYLLRLKSYRHIGSYSIIQSVTASLMKCLLGFKNFVSSGLIIGQLSGLFLAALSLFLLSWRSLKLAGKADREEIIGVAKEYSTFPKYELPNRLVTSLAGNLPVLLLSFYFDLQLVGIMSVAFVLGLTPIGLFANSISKVLYQRMSERKRINGNIQKECISFCRICFIFILPLFILLLFLPEGVFTFIFGDKWTGVAFYFKLLVPNFFMSLVVASLSFIPDLFLKQKKAIQIDFIYLILKAISLFCGIFMESFIHAIVFYTIVVVIMLGVKLKWYLSLVKKYESTRPEI